MWGCLKHLNYSDLPFYGKCNLTIPYLKFSLGVSLKAHSSYFFFLPHTMFLGLLKLEKSEQWCDPTLTKQRPIPSLTLDTTTYIRLNPALPLKSRATSQDFIPHPLATLPSNHICYIWILSLRSTVSINHRFKMLKSLLAFYRFTHTQGDMEESTKLMFVLLSQCL